MSQLKFTKATTIDSMMITKKSRIMLIGNVDKSNDDDDENDKLC